MDIGRCFLRQHPTYRLALFTERDSETPVAHWETAATSPSASLPTLVFRPEAESAQLRILAAFIVEEQRVREAERGSLSDQGRFAALALGAGMSPGSGALITS
ncbi:hypothetical protein B0H19DRAFT_1383875 [Mycena capillaripes]|nr:hypothetical protein B0H19DRAFT_1383875 [Mycena capillaripes]